MSNNLFSKELRQISIIASLLFELKDDLDPNLSLVKVHLQCLSATLTSHIPYNSMSQHLYSISLKFLSHLFSKSFDVPPTQYFLHASKHFSIS